MDINEKINFINKELNQGRSLKGIAQQLEIGYSTIKSKLKDAGYNKVDGIYVLMDSIKVQEKTVPAFPTAVQYRTIHSNANVIQEPNEENVEQLTIEQADELTKDILQRLAALEERVFHNNTMNNSIVVNLPDNIEKMMSSRINEKIYTRWQEFCKNQKYLAKDLLSMAILEYMEKYE